MTRYADLHVHTSYSDSTFSPEEVVAVATRKGLAAIAISDHDTVDAIPLCRSSAEGTDLEIIPAIEMTAEGADVENHLLGYFIDWKAGWFRKKLKEIQLSRIERVHAMVEKLKAHGIDIKAEDVFALAGHGTVGRLHMAQAIMKTGRVASYRDVFGKYIGFRKPCYVSYTKFTPKEAIRTILDAGGVPVLAHPGVMGQDGHLPELIKYGLRGIEVYHTDHKAEVSKRYEKICLENGLIMTGGSDCHGMGKGKILMGGVKVPYEVVERLREESQKIKSAG